jgi:hypothetical protein
MFVVSSASAGDRQSLPHFYCDHPARKSTNRDSPKVTKNRKSSPVEEVEAVGFAGGALSSRISYILGKVLMR